MIAIRDISEILPAGTTVFTLTDLMDAVQRKSARRIHKASFRRVLRETRAVVGTNVYRAEGRGRPAQYFRWNPRLGANGRLAVAYRLARWSFT